MTIVRGLRFICIYFCFVSGCPAHNPCGGKGTNIFFVNGVFNNRKIANQNLNEFIAKTRIHLSRVKNLRYDLAFVEGDPDPTKGVFQLALAVLQRGIDDFQTLLALVLWSRESSFMV